MLQCIQLQIDHAETDGNDKMAIYERDLKDARTWKAWGNERHVYIFAMLQEYVDSEQVSQSSLIHVILCYRNLTVK